MYKLDAVDVERGLSHGKPCTRCVHAALYTVDETIRGEQIACHCRIAGLSETFLHLLEQIAQSFTSGIVSTIAQQSSEVAYPIQDWRT